MKKNKVYPRDKKLHEELEKGYPDGLKRFFDLLKKAVQPQPSEQELKHIAAEKGRKAAEKGA